MDLYSIALFVHMLGFITLFGALILLQPVGARLRAMSTWEDARLLLSLMQPTRGMFIASSIFLLASGLYMTSDRWGFATPWVATALAGLVLFIVLGAAVVGRKLRAIWRVTGGSEGTISEPMRSMISHPALWTSIFGMNFGALAFVWLMTTKPGWVGSIGVTVVMIAIGCAIGAAVARQRTSQKPSSSAETERFSRAG